MRKLVGNASSKYSFNPEQFDIDVAANKKQYSEQKNIIHEKLNEILVSDVTRMDETLSIMIEILRKLKEKYRL